MWYFRRTAMAQQMIGSDKRRLGWFLLSGVVMLASAYSIGCWLGTVGAISGWIGLPQHELEIPRLQAQARFWAASALILPFVGAMFVWLGREKPFDRSDIASFVFECGRCFATSILGTLGFLASLFGLEVLIHKIG